MWDRRLQQMPTPQARPSTVHNFRVVSTSNFVGDPSGLVKPVVEGSTSANAIQFAHIEKRGDKKKISLFSIDTENCPLLYIYCYKAL